MDICSTNILFQVTSSGTVVQWARYDNVGNGTENIGSFISSLGGSVCHNTGSGYLLTDGTITSGGNTKEVLVFY